MMDARKLVCSCFAGCCFFALIVSALGVGRPIETSLSHSPFGFGRFVAVVSVLLGLQAGLVYAAACFKNLIFPDREQTVMLSPVRKLLLAMETHLLLLATLASTYQAGISPPGRFPAVTDEWEHSRYKGKNKERLAVKDQGRRHPIGKILHAGSPGYVRHALKHLFKAIGIPRKVHAAGASRESDSTLMGSNRETESENTSGSDSRLTKHNGVEAVVETADTWVVTSTATHHATGNRSLLSGFKTVDGDLNIQPGDGRRMPASGRGSVITEAVVLPDVCFVPGLNQNIVSISQLIKRGCRVEMNHDACYIRSATDRTIIGEAPVGENGMFKLEYLKAPLVN